MRLLDKLLSEKFDTRAQNVDQIREVLGASELVVADNVAEYWASLAGEKMPFPSDFPSVMLPFENTFIEMRWPRGGRSSQVDSIESTGVLFWMNEPTDLDIRKSMGVKLSGDDIKYHLQGFVFFQHKDRRWNPMLLSMITLPVNDAGEVVGDPDFGGSIGYAIKFLNPEVPGVTQDQMEQLQKSLLTTTVVPALLAISFMHCRNVTVRKETPPAPLSKKYQKRTGRPLLRYHVIQIDHMKQVLEREGHASTEGLKKALHICRGHFKHYGRDGKGLLFGKHVATVWIPMHTRGAVEEGVVVKDYNVK